MEGYVERIDVAKEIWMNNNNVWCDGLDLARTIAVEPLQP